MAKARRDVLTAQGKIKATIVLDRMGFVIFGVDGKTALVTEDLNSRHAVAIVSSKAAILAHIVPHAPEESRHNYKDAEHCIKTAMSDIMRLYRHLESKFTSEGPNGVMVYEIYEGKTALEDQLSILMISVSKAKGLPVKTFSYDVKNVKIPGVSQKLDKGIMVVEGGGPGRRPVMWVEDQRREIQIEAAGASTSNAPKKK